MEIPLPWEQLLQSPAGRVLEVLRPGGRTADEIAEALQITTAGARQHLGNLQRDGLVALAGQRPGTRKPFHEYRLTALGEQALSRAYLPVLRALVLALGEELTGDQARQLFARVGRRLAQSAAAPRPGASPSATATAVLNGLGGSVRSVTTDGLVRLEGEGCPLAELVRTTPITCEAVRSLLEEVTSTPVTQCCHHGEHPRCGFQLRDK